MDIIKSEIERLQKQGLSYNDALELALQLHKAYLKASSRLAEAIDNDIIEAILATEGMG